MEHKTTLGHLAALLTILIWGTTFISTKLLLDDFRPVEILFCRFSMGYAALWLVCPRRLTGTARAQELAFAAMGLSGICLYYLLENVALTYTMASNVGVITSAAPFFTALLAHWFLRDEPPRARFFAGFAVAMTGIFLIHQNGARLALDPRGDLLALLAAASWACYAILTRRIAAYRCGAILATRRVFFYGLLWMLPALAFSGFDGDAARFFRPVNLLNLLFLGLGASALCFVTWSFSVRTIGVLQTSVYIYLVPVVTVLTSVLILREPVTPLSLLGTCLTLAGLLLSESGVRKKEP